MRRYDHYPRKHAGPLARGRRRTSLAGLLARVAMDVATTVGVVFSRAMARTAGAFELRSRELPGTYESAGRTRWRCD